MRSVARKPYRPGLWGPDRAALDLHERNLADCQRVYGPDQAGTITARSNLAHACQVAWTGNGGCSCGKILRSRASWWTSYLCTGV
jgi:hypothetical protein